jgi:cell division protein FtsN
MHRDYKNHIPAHRKNLPGSFRKPAFWIVGSLLGVGVVGLSAYLLQAQKKNTPASITPASRGVAATTMPAVNAAEPAAGAVRRQEPRFTFYKILSEQEVIIPENEVRTLRREEQNSKASLPAGRYYIQAGSFVNQQDADNLRSQMLQISIPARLEMIQVDNATWFRVKVGPYATLSDVEKVRQYLRTHRFDSVVQKANH